MVTWDLAIVETGNGGDLVLRGNDLAVVHSIENMPYLGMFGGNVEQSTTPNRQLDSKDYWGNDLLMKSDAAIQFNSITEKTLNSVGLTSSGRVIIENSIKEDLQFLSPGAEIKVDVSITATDRIDVIIKITLDFDEVKTLTIVFAKSPTLGDWYILDFNDDFFI